MPISKAAIAFLIAMLTMVLMRPAQAGELVQDRYFSEILGREVRYTAFLPNEYGSSEDVFPVTYLLHGVGGDEYEWARKGGAVETLSGLLRRGLIRPTVVIMPSFGPDSWWTDAAAEQAGSAFMRELIPLVEQRFRVGTERSARAIGGLSMGGYGALNLVLKHPDQFCGLALVSAAIYDPVPPPTSRARNAAQFKRNGRFDETMWSQLNYPSRLPAYRASPFRVPMWIVAGDHDRLDIALASAQLFSQMVRIQPRQVELRIVDGDHEWLTFRDALFDAMKYVDGQCRAGATR